MDGWMDGPVPDLIGWLVNRGGRAQSVENDLIAIVAACAIVLGVCVFYKPPALFVVRIYQGLPIRSQGKVTDAFLAVLEALCQEQGVEKGEVRGVRRGKFISLWFSRKLPGPFRQRLRNWWSMSGWPAPPRP
jgi:hypothetical protein